MQLNHDNPSKEIVLVGNSWGSFELLYIASMVEFLLKETQQDTKVCGVILTQSGGIFEQSLVDLVRRAPLELAQRSAIDMLYPTR